MAVAARGGNQRDGVGLCASCSFSRDRAHFLLESSLACASVMAPRFAPRTAAACLTSSKYHTIVCSSTKMCWKCQLFRLAKSGPGVQSGAPTVAKTRLLTRFPADCSANVLRVGSTPSAPLSRRTNLQLSLVVFISRVPHSWQPLQAHPCHPCPVPSRNRHPGRFCEPPVSGRLTTRSQQTPSSSSSPWI